jgi:hypothetical protein
MTAAREIGKAGLQGRPDLPIFWPSEIFQLFLDVFTKTELKTCSTFVLLHSGHFTFFSPCFEIFSIR